MTLLDDINYYEWIIKYYNEQISGLTREKKFAGVKKLTEVRDRYIRTLELYKEKYNDNL